MYLYFVAIEQEVGYELMPQAESWKDCLEVLYEEKDRFRYDIPICCFLDISFAAFEWMLFSYANERTELLQIER
jgi:hypothetical protein